MQGPEPQGFGPGLEASLTPILRAAVASAGLQSGVTSYGLLAAGGNSSGPSVLVETLFGALGALAVLVFVFASFLAFVPLIIAAVSILTTFLLVLALTYLTDVSFVVQFLIALVGLGVAIDYSLLLVSRWREERAHGHTNDEAVVVAVQTAGHAVLASGVTVAISLLALVVVPVPFLRSMGLGGMLIPLVSVAVVLTLLPALLSKLGPRVDWPRIRHDAVAARGWSAWARLIVRRRWVAAGVAAAALGLVIAPVFGLKIGQAGTNSLARSGSAFNVLQQLQKGGVGNGILTPIEVLVPQGQAKAAVAAAAGVRGVRTAAVGGTKGGLAVVDVIPAKETVDSASNGVVNDVRTAVENATDGSVGVAGTGAIVQDYFRAVYHNFPYVLALIAVITFVLLVRTFRSVLLPVKAVLLNLVSLGAVFGVVVFFWQRGHGSDAVFGVSPTGAITFWLPVIIFAFLSGCRWTTRCSSWPGCGRNTTPPAGPTSR
ncbi:MAG: MMPL family transporter [Nocardioidaceae bacterium]